MAFTHPMSRSQQSFTFTHNLISTGTLHGMPNHGNYGSAAPTAGRWMDA